MTTSKLIAVRSITVRVRCNAAPERVVVASKTVASRTQRGPPPSLSDHSTKQTAKLIRRDTLVLAHIHLAKAIALRLYASLPVHVDLDDLVQAGVLGLIDAANKFDSRKHIAFPNYAKHRMKGAMLDSLRKLDWASRDMRRRQKQVEATKAALMAILQRTPTEAEVAEKMGINIERWHQIMLDLRNFGPVSTSARANENDDLPAPDFPGTPETQPDSICAHQQLRGMLGETIKTLPERYQKVVVLYYDRDMTMKEIGGILGVNESRVSQMHKTALQKMANVLHNNGIDSVHAF